jgi:hypothetical protein
MEFIRQNIGVAVAGAACVILAALLALVNGKQSDRVAEELTKRETASRALQSLSQTVTYGDKRVYVNEALIDQERLRVQHNKQSLADVTAAAEAWNRDGFEILEAPIDGLGMVAAFPVPPEHAIKSEFRYNLSLAYLAAADELLTPLTPAMAPTMADVEAGVEAEKERLSYSPKHRAMQDQGANLTEIARENVRAELRSRAAAGKRIYVSPEVVGRVFTEPDPDITFDKLWKAQVSLWVMSDVIGAINDLNLSVTEDLAPEEVRVSRSAVRALEYITVNEAYAVSSQGRPVDSVTQRGCNEQYDVVHYQFKVVMPLDYIPDLEKALMSRNYHTVLNATMERFTLPPENTYELGHEPLMHVTFQGELLLLASWERGTLGKVERNGEMVDGWVYPPLMPYDILKNSLPVQAYREMDKKRLANQTPVYQTPTP